jgi:hypothetical protein
MSRRSSDSVQKTSVTDAQLRAQFAPTRMVLKQTWIDVRDNLDRNSRQPIEAALQMLIGTKLNRALFRTEMARDQNGLETP